MTKGNLVKVLGLATTAMGIAASLLSEWVGEKTMDRKIEEKVNEAFAKQNDKDKKGPDI